MILHQDATLIHHSFSYVKVELLSSCKARYLVGVESEFVELDPGPIIIDFCTTSFFLFYFHSVFKDFGSVN